MHFSLIDETIVSFTFKQNKKMHRKDYFLTGYTRISSIIFSW